MKTKKLLINTPLGEITGKWCFFGGVYSNLEALKTLQNICKEKNIMPNQVVNTGDIIAYCANPEESVQNIKTWGCWNILGNTEEQIRENKDDCGCNFNEGSLCESLSQDWYGFAKNNISQSSREFFTTLPDSISFTIKGKKGKIFHGSPQNISEFIFPSTAKEKKLRIMTEENIDIAIGGHSGIPFIQKISENKI